MDAEILKALADLAWPVLATVILLILLPTIKRILHSREVSIKFGDMEVSVQDASDQLRKQVEDMQNQIRALTEQGFVSSDEVKTQALPDEETLAVSRLILWVDDKPANNAYEIAKFQGDGYEISTAESTSAALALLENGTVKPNAIISDLGRREGVWFNRTAGIDLIRGIRANDPSIPIYIYSSADCARKYEKEVYAAGGNGITASPVKLFEFVNSEVRSQSKE